MKREPRPGDPAAEPASTSAADTVARLYEQHYPLVWRILGRAGIWRDEERCEVAHDVFIVALERYPPPDPATPLAAWLAAITWNVAKNYRARARAHREVPVDQPEPASSAASPEQLAADRRYLLDVFAGLDDERRMVFDMYVIEGFDVPEIAVALGIPVGTARTRLRLAREHVQATHARLEAHAAHAEHRPVATRAMVPFGLGAWRELSRPFEEMPPDAEGRIWRDICRTISAGRAIGRTAVTVGAALAGKTAGALLGVGALLGGGAVFVALRLLSPPLPSPPITRAPEAVAVAPAAISATTAPSEPVATPGAAPPAVVQASTAPPSPTGSAVGAVKGLDPEEVRLIQQAQTAVTRKDYDAARAALREHATRFPSGQLVDDRQRLLSQIPGGAPSATPSTMSTTGAPPAGSAHHRLFGTDE